MLSIIWLFFKTLLTVIFSTGPDEEIAAIAAISRGGEVSVVHRTKFGGVHEVSSGIFHSNNRYIVISLKIIMPFIGRFVYSATRIVRQGRGRGR